MGVAQQRCMVPCRQECLQPAASGTEVHRGRERMCPRRGGQNQPLGVPIPSPLSPPSHLLPQCPPSVVPVGESCSNQGTLERKSHDLLTLGFAERMQGGSRGAEQPVSRPTHASPPSFKLPPGEGLEIGGEPGENSDPRVSPHTGPRRVGGCSVGRTLGHSGFHHNYPTPQRRGHTLSRSLTSPSPPPLTPRLWPKPVLGAGLAALI